MDTLEGYVVYDPTDGQLPWEANGWYSRLDNAGYYPDLQTALMSISQHDPHLRAISIDEARLIEALRCL